MVKLMRQIKLIALPLLASLLLSQPLLAAPQGELPVLSQQQLDIKVKIRPKQVQLGNPVTLVIEGDDLAESIDKIDWLPFKTDFVIDDIDQGSSLLRVRFYPLRSGEFSIAGQRAGVIDIPTAKISVVDNPAVEIDWSGPEPQLYSQQQFSWQAKVKVNNPAFQVSMQAREGDLNSDITVYLPQQGVDSQTSDGTQSSSLMEKMLGKTEQLLAAYELPGLLKQQSLELHSPMVQIKNTTNRLWKFFDYSHTVEIRPLPNFLPLSVAVGQLAWQIEPPARGYQAGRLHYWQWQLYGQNVTEDYLKSTVYQLLRQLDNSSNIEWMAESMEASTSFNEQGMQSSVTVNLPYRIQQPGLVVFPQLTLRAFDPLTAKVSQQSIDSIKALALPGWMVWLLQWLLLLLLVLFGFVGLLLIKQAWLNWRFKRALLACLSFDELWQAMQNWQQQHRRWQLKPDWRQVGKQPLNWNSYYQKLDAVNGQGSLQQWRDWYLQFYLDSQHFETLMQEMGCYFYAADNGNKQWRELAPHVQLWAKHLALFPTKLNE